MSADPGTPRVWTLRRGPTFTCLCGLAFPGGLNTSVKPSLTLPIGEDVRVVELGAVLALIKEAAENGAFTSIHDGSLPWEAFLAASSPEAIA